MMKSARKKKFIVFYGGKRQGYHLEGIYHPKILIPGYLLELREKVILWGKTH